jgi:hypothetical protein
MEVRVSPAVFTFSFLPNKFATGTVYGAETISNKVEEMLGNFVPASQPNRPYVLDQLRRQFDEWYKAIFGNDDYNTFIFKFLDSQGSEKEIIVERYVLAPRNLITQFTLTWTCISQKIKACFDECISPVLKIIKRQIRKGPAPKVSSLVITRNQS